MQISAPSRDWQDPRPFDLNSKHGLPPLVKLGMQGPSFYGRLSGFEEPLVNYNTVPRFSLGRNTSPMVAPQNLVHCSTEEAQSTNT